MENIIFYNTVTKDKVLSSFDLIVTSNPDIIINYSDKLTIIKYESFYNKPVKFEININSLICVNVGYIIYGILKNNCLTLLIYR